MTPSGEPVGGHGFHHLGRLHLAGNQWPAPRPRPGSPRLPGTSASARVGELLGSVVHGKTLDPQDGREGFCFPEQVRRDPVKLL